jgi:superfamily II DNA or RNA helicase
MPLSSSSPFGLPSAETLAPFFARIQKECLPGVWSKGVALARDGMLSLDRATATEIVVRVLVKDRPVSPKVTLWPEDDDSYCDCGDRNELCAHIAAVVIALKSGKEMGGAAGGAPEAAGTANTAGTPLASGTPSSTPRLSYRLTRDAGALVFDRLIVYPARDGAPKEVPLIDTLVAYIGGISSGRIVSPPIPATREDFGVDSALGTGPRRGKLDRATLGRLLVALSECSHITLDGSPIQVSGKPTGFKARLTDHPSPSGQGDGFRLEGAMDSAITEVFTNGAALCGDTLRPVESPSLTAAENEALFGNGNGKGKGNEKGSGRVFKSPAEITELVAVILPSLQKKLSLEIATERLPVLRQATPHIAIRLESLDAQTLVVVPTIDYLEKPSRGEILVPDPAVEKQLARKLQSELHLNPGQPVRMQGQGAVDFVMRLQSQPNDWRVQGEGLKRFSVTSALEPHVVAKDDGNFQVRFDCGSGSVDTSQVSQAQVFQAWREGAQYVPLLGGGWAPLPRDWLSKYGDRISALLEARGMREGSPLPAHFQPLLADLCEELHEPLPPRLAALREKLEHFEGIPKATLPEDLRATLRHYQQTGVNWLSFLRDSGMGAMLADDMGLGKTLQALCAIRGRTLIVAPTSVLSSWAGQIAQFRPSLQLSTYYGANRKLEPQAHVTLTTYALLRLDREALSAENWDTIVLDEAQTVKNPESQVARAAHGLRGAFRIALSGTPIENRLDDLWSQFQFLNPGLLGTRESFRENFTESKNLQSLRARIKPFLLRRLKREVAPELPPRTEIVLHCELSLDEQKLYDSILAASRKEVLEKLEQSGSVFAALEMLLRLRQACCSPALVPGQKALILGDAPSSKLQLLMETLDESISLGHRALVFSQWTSFLDLIEPELKSAGLAFVRLDGTTRDRASVVEEFQRPDGPPVMLISLKAGGVGLTLTAADHIFLMDPWWNPAVEDQAADRAHRIGQENPVLIHRLVAKGTVEDRILELQKRKLELAGAVLEGSAHAISITKDDILELLGL